MKKIITKKLTDEDIKELLTRINNIKKDLEHCDKYEETVKNLVPDNMNEALLNISNTRKNKAKSALSTIRKFRCLDRSIITDEGFDVLLKAVKYGDVDDLKAALFYYEGGLLAGTVSQEEYNSLVELIRIKTNNEPKTFK